MRWKQPSVARSSQPPRRGVAMLLVVVALGVGVVLAGVAISSRQPATRIGAHAADDAAARWGAIGAAEFAAAALQSDALCVEHAAAQGGQLIQSFPFEGGTASVHLSRLDGTPPQAGDRELLMTIRARVGEMTSTMTKQVSLAMPVPLEKAADTRLSEFAIFASSAAIIQDGALVDVSPGAGEDDTLTPVKIGGSFMMRSGIDVKSGAVLNNVAMYLDAAATSAADDCITADNFSWGERLGYAIPTIRETTPPAVAGLPAVAVNLLAFTTGLLDQVLSPGNYSSLSCSNGTVVTIGTPGQTTVYKFSGISLSNSAVLRIQGNVMAQVSGAFSVASNAAIELADGNSSVEFYVGRNTTLDNCAIGLPRVVARDNARSRGDITDHPQADRVRISPLHTVSGGQATITMTIRGGALVVACIRAPQTNLMISGNSTLFGRATADRFTLETGSALLYDPRLDPRAGFTALDGPLYKNRTPIPEVLTLLSTFNTSSGAQALQTSMQTAVAAAWSTEDNILVKPVAAEAVPTADDDDAIVDDDDVAPMPVASATPSMRVKGKLKSKNVPSDAEDFED